VAREALVFYALKDLHMELTADDVRSIYSGEITAWTAFSTPCEIIPYQSLYDSAAQSAMQVFMGEEKLMRAPQISRDVGGWEPVVENAPFRTVKGGVGYTLKKLWDDNPMKGLTALPIDGKLPGEEGYPAKAEVYMAVRADEDNSNVQALIDWVLSDQGQELVEKAGYVGVK
jgi:phosphate transport system substrate-binding protein